ncbi:MAG TPA: RidA family protein [Candidatus Sumerlaeota bacterium]|nr:RidA family protein [Candidatus Sumerlaeota bacterium]
MNLSRTSGDKENKPKKVPLVIEGAAPALGQASQAIKYGEVVYISGQLPIDPATNRLAGDDITVQTETCIKSLTTICNFIGGALSNIYKVTVYVIAMEDLPAMEKVYREHFSFQPPVRTIVCVSRLPMNARIQIDAIIHPPVRETTMGAAF